MKILFIIPCKTFIPSGAVRVLQYLRYLDAKGIRYNILNYHSPLGYRLMLLKSILRNRARIIDKPLFALIDLCAYFIEKIHLIIVHNIIAHVAIRYDAVFIQWILLPEPLVLKLMNKNIKIIYDFDDAVFLAEPDKARTMISSAWKVTTGSHYNAEYASKLNSNCSFIPSSVPTERFISTGVNESRSAISNNRFIIGWIGSISTLKYLNILVEPLNDLSEEGCNIELLVAGTWYCRESIPSFTNNISIREIPTYRDIDIPHIVDQIDIGVLPLFDTDWEKGKCGMKALIYMAGAKPVVCSNVGENPYIISDGVNGFLATTSLDWKNKIRLLMSNSSLRTAMGHSGEKTVEDKYSTHRCFDELYSSVLSHIVD